MMTIVSAAERAVTSSYCYANTTEAKQHKRHLWYAVLCVRGGLLRSH